MGVVLDCFCKEICNPIYVGDIVEFGTGSGSTTEIIRESLQNEEIKIFTFDGFKGLPKTNKVVPKNTGWEEGSIVFNEKTTRNRLIKYNNVYVIKEMFCNVQIPGKYNITKISGVNIDVDIYESAVAALNFIDKCIWNNLLITFDDWGAGENQIPSEIDQHEKLAFYEFIEEKKYKYYFHEDCMALGNYEQALVSIIR